MYKSLLLLVSLFMGSLQAIVVISNNSPVQVVTSQGGALDSTFATDGFYTNLTGRNLETIKLQSDGKIVLAGDNADGDFFVGRLNSNGAVDQTFGGNNGDVAGFYSSDNGRQINAMQIQSDGKIILGGHRNTFGVLARLNSDGSIDDTFGGNNGDAVGFYDSSSHGILNAVRTLQIQSDGKIVVGGQVNLVNMAVARFNTNGTVDDTFGGNNGDADGFYYNTTGNLVRDLQIQLDGKIVFAGRKDGDTWYVGRLNSDGTVDDTFGGNNGDADGFYENTDGKEIRAIQIQFDGKILLAGETSTPDWYVGRLNSDGSVDDTFGGNNGDADGFYSNSNGKDIYAMEIEIDGKILLAGRNDNQKWYMGRLNSNGVPDSTFASGGFYTNSDSNRLDAIQVQQDGKIILAGTGSGSVWHAGRFTNNISVSLILANIGGLLGLVG